MAGLGYLVTPVDNGTYFEWLLIWGVLSAFSSYTVQLTGLPPKRGVF